MSKKDQCWQVEVGLLGASRYGALFLGARKNSRGKWTRKGADVPAHVAEYLMLYKTSGDAGNWRLSGVDTALLEDSAEVTLQRGSTASKAKFLVKIPEPDYGLPARDFKEYSIDLKCSCWSTDAGVWNSYAKTAYTAIKRALQGKGPAIRIRSAPRKEIRYMTVEIVPDGKSALIDVSCSVEWDDWFDLEDTLGLPEGALVDQAEFLPHTDGGHPGVTVGAAVNSRGAAAMRKIDHVENQTIEDSADAWKDLTAQYE